MANDSSNFFRDNEDLLFQFRNGLKWKEIVELTENGFTLPDGPKDLEEALGFYETVMEATGEFVAKEIAPRANRIDAKGTRLESGEVVFSQELNDVFGGMKELGLFGLSAPRELGGSNAPLALYFVANELIARGDVSAMTHYGFHGGVATSLYVYSIREGSAKFEDGRLVKTRWDEAIRRISAGDDFGCMVLTEPGAGSDLGVIRTKAVERGGKWYLTGEKIFITSGHGQYQLVLARSEDEKDAPGLKGLSLFLVPRILEKNGDRIHNVRITKVEEKLGHHGSATCSLEYDESEGELIGERGQGFELMLVLMNSARIGVSVEAIGNAEAAYRMAKAYASERSTMGKPIDRHELIAEKLVDMGTWIPAMRAFAFEAISAVEISQRLDLKLRTEPPTDPEELAAMKARQSRLAKRARRLTPLLKYVTSEKSVEIARDAMQIFGGMGYIDETGVHKLLRDALVMPVYEGTSQIQALMATKDHLLWAARDPAGFLRRGARARLLARTAQTQLLRDVNKAEATVYRATETIMLRIFGQKVKAEWEGGLVGRDPAAWGRYLKKRFLRQWDAKSDFSQGLLHAERLTRMLADVAMGKVLAKQAQKFPEREALAKRFVNRMLLRVDATAKEIEHMDDSVLEAIAALEGSARSE
ncbi:acyl-CoA dehydrogenase family protein [Vulgatibacter incomptus]|uniref:Acyl-CoA dehydrogenase n=1 Tax=Vulgatibacter incomptus TaxID=1391653 RepID=A0A0K1PAA3_9BACT|nr:acyl-CoA dehydrogenase family protein [Vulgatibacter incomptus]AKU90468.1 Acyl-CoA dehydrogenase [Vulgatibacter incomptus]